ncbi:polysaccharide deacetylase family protein [Pseudogemmobacter faecipullorum]|uniref:Chitooligosaccharide deacetylase n=1 Tax=Pseudogemmobacter faecipullorum TaxID=2755041 RepID=A0ABS8CN03_9RHOB|nr:polysaccharide deacetylase [Pseudogemmobacter faecipullorum]MCB5410766.1 polysaccharide deacetylase [Pseudogemmobacter faecipullorum]
MHLTSRGFPLFLTFDLDAETMWTGRDPDYARRPVMMSQGAYGWKVGTDRILKLLAHYEARTTFFVPGLVVEQRPALMERILEAGHEIAHHSYSHRWILTLSHDEEREEMERGFEAIRRVTGQAPKGWRSPAAELSDISMDLMLEYGFEYSSNFFDDDSPYLHVVKGRQTDLVELPFRWVLDDAPFFQYSIALPGRTMQAPSAVAEAWNLELDALHAEKRMMMIGFHPQIIGQPSRLWALEQLLKRARDKGDVWIGRCDEMVADMRPRLQAAAA